MNNFKIIAKDGQARAGVLETTYGVVETPIFMPVGTKGTVKALKPEDLITCGAQIILGNTYHLNLRPGSKLIKKLGGLHQFMNWQFPILTDSGGFQAFSLGAAISHGVRKISARGPASRATPRKLQTEQRIPVGKIDEQGIHFNSHLDGSKHLLTPETSIEVQLDLGSDIVLVLDELLSPKHNKEYVKESLERTHRWELRSKDYFENNLKNSTNPKALLFGIVQGVHDKKIREVEAKWVGKQDFAGVSIGGSFGVTDTTEWYSQSAISEGMDWIVPNLPEEWPKHALGIGEVIDLFACIERGIDMFDCVSPTRRARNGSLYISPKNGGNIKNNFTLNISGAKFKEEGRPINPGCSCYTCQNYSKAYLRHLYLAQEILFHNLATIHNVFFILNLTTTIREAIFNKQFKRLRGFWLS